MARQSLNYGAFANDPNADSLYSAWTKQQLNETELYTLKKSKGAAEFTVGPNSTYATIALAAAARTSYGLVTATGITGILMQHTDSYNKRLFVLSETAAYPHTTDLSALVGRRVAFDTTDEAGFYRTGTVFWERNHETWALLADEPFSENLGSVTIGFYYPKYAEIAIEAGVFQEITSSQELGDMSFTVFKCPEHTAGFIWTTATAGGNAFAFNGTDIVIDGLAMEYATGLGTNNPQGSAGFLPRNKSGQSIKFFRCKTGAGYWDGIYATSSLGTLRICNCDIRSGYDAIRLDAPAYADIRDNYLEGWQSHQSNNTQEASCVALGAASINQIHKHSLIVIKDNHLSVHEASFAREPVTATDIFFTSNNTITTGGDVDFTKLTWVGGWITVATTSGSANDGQRQVATVSATVITTVETTIVTETAVAAGSVTIHDTAYELRNAGLNQLFAIDCRNYVTSYMTVLVDGNLFDINCDEYGNRANTPELSCVEVNNVGGTSPVGGKVVVTGNKVKYRIGENYVQTGCRFINNQDSAQVTVEKDSSNAIIDGPVFGGADVGTSALVTL